MLDRSGALKNLPKVYKYVKNGPVWPKLWPFYVFGPSEAHFGPARARARRGPDFVNWPYLGLDEELSGRKYHFSEVFGGPRPPGSVLDPSLNT
jgi:hypothetical protein